MANYGNSGALCRELPIPSLTPAPAVGGLYDYNRLRTSELRVLQLAILASDQGGGIFEEKLHPAVIANCTFTAKLG